MLQRTRFFVKYGYFPLGEERYAVAWMRKFRKGVRKDTHKNKRYCLMPSIAEQ